MKILKFPHCDFDTPSTTRKNGGKMRSRLVRPKIDVYQKTFFWSRRGWNSNMRTEKTCFMPVKRGYAATYKSKCMSVESEKFNRIICRSKNNAFFLLRWNKIHFFLPTSSYRSLSLSISRNWHKVVWNRTFHKKILRQRNKITNQKNG